jgi:hypothetical protein
MKRVSKRQAEAAVRAIGKAFGAEEGYGPKLVKDLEGYYGGVYRYAIVWECGGSYDWPFLLQGGFDEELFSLIHPEFEPDRDKARKRCERKPVKLPKGVVAEAINHYSIALYSEEEY